MNVKLFYCYMYFYHLAMVNYTYGLIGIMWMDIYLIIH